MPDTEKEIITKHHKKIGRKGGKATFQKYGSDHMKEIRKKRKIYPQKKLANE